MRGATFPGTVTAASFTDFNPRSSCEERHCPNRTLRAAEKFQSTLLMRGATSSSSIRTATKMYFNPRSSCEERRALGRLLPSIKSNFNPRSSCEERPQRIAACTSSTMISIHAPHARSDDAQPHHGIALVWISIHAPHARSDYPPTGSSNRGKFQSTLLMRGATLIDEELIQLDQISIHAPHARSDIHGRRADDGIGISIHAPHARSDLHRRPSATRCAYFNPRSSCEERLDLFPSW